MSVSAEEAPGERPPVDEQLVQRLLEVLLVDRRAAPRVGREQRRPPQEQLVSALSRSRSVESGSSTQKVEPRPISLDT
jgi:hypothetical protein